MHPDDPFSLLILEFAKTLGVPPVTAALLIPLIIAFANRGARLIPDNATGPLKWLRIALVVLGIHVKDNSGVPAARTEDGVAIRQAVPDTLPSAEAAEEGEQGVLLLDREVEIPRMFVQGNRALQSNQKED